MDAKTLSIFGVISSISCLFCPAPPVAPMIPILYDDLINNLSTNYAPPAKEGTT
jgi:hypothetical protein